MVKNIKYTLFVLILNIMTINVFAQRNPLDSLLTNPIQPNNYRETLRTLKQIRESGDIKYLQSLKKVKLAKQNKIVPDLILKIDTLAIINIELQATILLLEINKKEFKNNDDKVRYLIGLINEKLNNKPLQTINAEITVLKENATSFTPFILSEFDIDTNTTMKLIYLSVLENSTDPKLENDILIRIDTYKTSYPLYNRMLILLSKIGGDKAIDYYKNNVEKSISVSQDIKDFFLKNLYKQTNDTNLKNEIETKNKAVSNLAKQTNDTIIEKQLLKVDYKTSIFYPEDMGENFSKKSLDTLLFVLSTNKDKITLRKAAKALGDRNIRDTLDLAGNEKEIIKQFTQNYIDLSTSEDVNDREEAYMQMQRLWHLASPVLLNNLNNPDRRKAEFSSRALALMANEPIILEILQKYKSESNQKQKMYYRYTLDKIRTNSKQVLIPDRIPLSMEEAQELYHKLVEPELIQQN